MNWVGSAAERFKAADADGEETEEEEEEDGGRVDKKAEMSEGEVIDVERGVGIVLGVNRFFLAALGASLPHVVPADRLMMANSVTPTSGTVATFLGAGAGFLLRLLFGPGTNGTALLRDGVAYVQAGGGIVADSDPSTEDQESQNKAAAVVRAISVAQSFQRVVP